MRRRNCRNERHPAARRVKGIQRQNGCLSPDIRAGTNALTLCIPTLLIPLPSIFTERGYRYSVWPRRVCASDLSGAMMTSLTSVRVFSKSCARAMIRKCYIGQLEQTKCCVMRTLFASDIPWQVIGTERPISAQMILTDQVKRLQDKLRALYFDITRSDDRDQRRDSLKPVRALSSSQMTCTKRTARFTIDISCCFQLFGLGHRLRACYHRQIRTVTFLARIASQDRASGSVQVATVSFAPR